MHLMIGSLIGKKQYFHGCEFVAVSRLLSSLSGRVDQFFDRVTNTAIVQQYRELMCQKAYILLGF